MSIRMVVVPLMLRLISGSPFSLMRALQKKSAGQSHTPASGLGAMALDMAGRKFGWTPESIFFFLSTFPHAAEIMHYLPADVEVQSLSFSDVDYIIQRRKLDGKSNPGMLFPPKCLFAFEADAPFPTALTAIQLVRDVQRYGLSDNCFWHVLIDGLVFLEPRYPENSFVSGNSTSQDIALGRLLRGSRL